MRTRTTRPNASLKLMPTEPDSELGAPIPFPRHFSFPFLKLPLEIRLKIYRLLFRCSIPLHPTIAPSPSPNLLYSPLPSPKTNFPTSLLLTNRQIHIEASTELWGSNQILLQFPLKFAYEYANTSPSTHHGRQHFTSRGLGFLPSPSQLSLVHNLVIEVYVFRDAQTRLTDLPHAYTQVSLELALLCNALKDSHKLERLEIRFTNIRPRLDPSYIKQTFDIEGVAHSRMAPGAIGAPFPRNWSPACCGFSGRRVFGEDVRFIGQVQELCEQAIAVDEKVLGPLMELRGVREVVVNGRVTDDWGRSLKRAIEREKDAL